MTTAAARYRLHYVVAITWLLITLSLASWWMAIGLSLPPRMHRMFLWEGAAFIGLLVAGGFAIVRAIRREHLRRQALETFFMSFTHDLKTSLASVGLQAENLREEWPASADRVPLDRLLHDLVRLQIQLENSLFVAQPDGRLLRERIATAPAIARLAEDWPELVVNVHGSADVIADARAFDAVVRNVLQNAVIHGGAHEVNVSVETAESGNCVRVTLVDDGRGVATDVFDGLGRPFARGSRTSGTGVGLFVCSQLTARMNGALKFLRAAERGRGLTVVLELPGDALMSRVLLVEDDESLGRTLAERLQKEHLDVRWAQTIADAEQAFGDGSWDLAILDVKLPDGSGFGLARMIKRTSLTPIMFMTALNSAENRLEGFEIGADEYLPKPFHLKEFVLRVRHVLATERVPEIVRARGRVIDLRALTVVTRDGDRTFLQVRDGRVLRLLIAATPNVVDRTVILDRVWGRDQFPTPRAVDNAIVRLRQALKDDSNELIRSVRGIGYQWTPDEGGL